MATDRWQSRCLDAVHQRETPLAGAAGVPTEGWGQAAAEGTDFSGVAGWTPCAATLPQPRHSRRMYEDADGPMVTTRGAEPPSATTKRSTTMLSRVGT